MGRSSRCTPLSLLSSGKGTRMAPANADGGGAFAALIAYSHRPLRQRQLASPRTSCGRGYSRHAFSAVTLAPHLVSSALSKARQACE